MSSKKDIQKHLVYKHLKKGPLLDPGKMTVKWLFCNKMHVVQQILKTYISENKENTFSHMLDTVKAAAHEHKDNHKGNHKTVLLPETHHPGIETRKTPPL